MRMDARMRHDTVVCHTAQMEPPPYSSRVRKRLSRSLFITVITRVSQSGRQPGSPVISGRPRPAIESASIRSGGEADGRAHGEAIEVGVCGCCRPDRRRASERGELVHEAEAAEASTSLPAAAARRPLLLLLACLACTVHALPSFFLPIHRSLVSQSHERLFFLLAKSKSPRRRWRRRSRRRRTDGGQAKRALLLSLLSFPVAVVVALCHEKGRERERWREWAEGPRALFLLSSAARLRLFEVDSQPAGQPAEVSLSLAGGCAGVHAVRSLPLSSHFRMALSPLPLLPSFLHLPPALPPRCDGRTDRRAGASVLSWRAPAPSHVPSLPFLSHRTAARPPSIRSLF